MKEEMQKTEMTNIESYPRENRLEAEGIAGAQSFIEITEGKLVEVQTDEKHLMECRDLLPYLKLHKDELKESILNGKYKPQPVRSAQPIVEQHCSQRNGQGTRMHHAAGNDALRRAGYTCLMDYYVKSHLQ